jgi:hypothetical protein
MPYDDESIKSRWREDEDWAILYDRGSREILTVSKLLQLTHAVHSIAGDRPPDKISMSELASELGQRGLGSVPFDIVVRVLETTGPISADSDPLANINLRQVKNLLGG